MRVLHIDTGREMRGGQWQVAFLLEGLAGGGVESALLSPADSELARHAAKQGFRVAPPTLGNVVRLGRRSDLIHAHTGRAHTLALAARHTPLVVARRVAFPVKRGMLSRWKYAKAGRYIAVSGYVKKMLVDADISSEKVSVVSDGVPELPESSRDGGVVAVATSDPRKGTALLREAAGQAGIDVAFVTDLRAALADAALLVYLSDLEGLGSGALMAMSAGVPVLASRAGGLVEVVEDGRTGILVENDAAAVAEAMRKLMRDPVRRNEMGRRGRQRVAGHFTVERMQSETRKVYEEVLA